MRAYLKNKVNPLVLDVGANVGNYSKDILSCNDSCSVLAFEPHPTTFKKLISNVSAANFKALNVGVGNKSGSLELFDYDVKDGSSHASLYRDVIKDLHKGNPISHSVEVVRLDDFLATQNVQVIDLLKIDTEGGEFNVLLGCEKLLKNRQIKAIHFEFNEMNIVSKASFKDFWDYLKDYELYRILPGGNLLNIKNYSPIGCEIYAFQNIVAILRDN